MPTGDWVARYGPEIDNLRAALDWAFGPDGDTDLGLELQAFSGTLWAESPLRREWRRRLDVAAARLHPLVAPEIVARIQTSRLTRTGLGQSGIEELRQAVATARLSGQPFLTAWALVQFSIRLLGSDGAAEVVQLLEEARSLVAAHGATKTLARVFSTLGFAAFVEGDAVKADRYWRESLAIARATGDRRSIDAASQNLAELLFVAGDLDAAIAAGREALAAARANGIRESTCPLTANLAAYLLLKGENHEGSTLAAQAFAEAQSVGEFFVATWAIQHLALVAARSNWLEYAARLQGFVDAVYATEQAKREPTEQATCDLVLDYLSKSLDPAEISRFLAEGAALTLEQAGQLALSLPRGIELP